MYRVKVAAPLKGRRRSGLEFTPVWREVPDEQMTAEIREDAHLVVERICPPEPSETDELRERLASAQRTNDELTQAVLTEGTRAADLNRENAAQDAEIALLTAEASGLQAKLAELAAALEAKEAERAALDTSNQRLWAELHARDAAEAASPAAEAPTPAKAKGK